jgi:hypothetical protein
MICKIFSDFLINMMKFLMCKNSLIKIYIFSNINLYIDIYSFKMDIF